MKGWIKLHTSDNGTEYFVRVSEIIKVWKGRVWTTVTVGRLGDDLCCKETAEEVMKLIEEAEPVGDSDRLEKKSLYKKLEEVKASCEGIRTVHKGNCDRSCPYWTGRRTWLCEVLGHANPEDWELEKIPEEYR